MNTVNNSNSKEENENLFYSQIKETLGEELFNKVQKCKVLVVGAGGIGCELLKNLVLSGFKTIEIIDLDTIDLSNLNRQFLFRKSHIGMSKSKIARESVLKYNPYVSITAHHGDIKSHDFSPNYFKQFDLVMNALDNLSARRHVNRVCLSVNVPLIESGTAGYLGQVTVIKKDVTECFECQPTATPKEFAVCTIRSNPSAPIHCIVWAKMLYGRLFGVADESNAITDMDDNIVQGDEESGTAVRDEQLPKEKEKGFGEWVFHKVFHTDIDRLSRMGDLWKEKKPPKPLSLDQLLESFSKPDYSDSTTLQQQSNGSAMMKDQKIWSFKENVEVFLDQLKKLHERNQKDGALTWDKDDEMALNFCVSASNIRSYIFDIPLKSKFDVKSMAGNIIPAIATTNAVIGGLIVMEALKVIGGDLNKCQATYLCKLPSRKRLLLPVQLETPNPNCYVCNQNYITLKIDTHKTTLKKLLTEVLKKHLAFHQPILTVGTSQLYEDGEEDLSKEELEERAKLELKFLSQYKMGDGALLVVDDFQQNFKVSILINHCESFGTANSNGTADKKEEEKWFEIVGRSGTPSATTTAATSSTENNNDVTITEDLDEVEFIEAPQPEEQPSKKRRLPESESELQTNDIKINNSNEEEESRKSQTVYQYKCINGDTDWNSPTSWEGGVVPPVNSTVNILFNSPDNQQRCVINYPSDLQLSSLISNGPVSMSSPNGGSILKIYQDLVLRNLSILSFYGGASSSVLVSKLVSEHPESKVHYKADNIRVDKANCKGNFTVESSVQTLIGVDSNSDNRFSVFKMIKYNSITFNGDNSMDYLEAPYSTDDSSVVVKINVNKAIIVTSGATLSRTQITLQEMVTMAVFGGNFIFTENQGGFVMKNGAYLTINNGYYNFGPNGLKLDGGSNILMTENVTIIGDVTLGSDSLFSPKMTRITGTLNHQASSRIIIKRTNETNYFTIYGKLNQSPNAILNVSVTHPIDDNIIESNITRLDGFLNFNVDSTTIPFKNNNFKIIESTQDFLEKNYPTIKIYDSSKSYQPITYKFYKIHLDDNDIEITLNIFQLAGWKIGLIVVGCIVGSCLLALCLYLYCRRRR
eukprot:gene4882-6090_t